MSETIPVRPDEAFDVPAVEQFLRQRLPDFPAGPLSVRQFPSGSSNLTYHLQAGAWEAVLRRPPLGPLPPKAHDMEREFRLLQPLHRVFPLAPEPYVFCGDTALIGAPFYVMEARPGVVYDRAWPAGIERTPTLCRQICEAFIDTLVALHQVDTRTAGLEAIGRPDGFLQRQVEGWVGRYQRARTDDVPHVEAVCRWLLERIPASPPPTIVHNDYKLNNMIFASADPARVIAVVDWEMTTVGDPLADVGTFIGYWTEAEDVDRFGKRFMAITALPEFPRRRDLLEAYARKSGRDLTQIGFYITFAYFKIAVICQQIYYRWKNGQTKDQRFALMGESVHGLVQHAWHLTEGGQI